MADQYSALEMLLDPEDQLADPIKRKATAAALRRQNALGVVGQLMGLEPTKAAGAFLQDQSQTSLKLALAKQQAAKEAAAQKARQAVEDQRWGLGYEQRERGIAATQANQAAAQANAAAGLDLRRQAAERAADAAASASEAKATAAGIKNRTEQDKYVGTLASANDVLSTLEKAYNHPGRKAATGKSWAAGYIPATDARDYRIQISKLAGGAFLAAFNSLRGGGQITEAEGKKATAALTTLEDLTASEEAHEQALQDFYNVMSGVRDRATLRLKEVGAPADIVETATPRAVPIPGSPAQGGRPQAPVGTQGAPIAVYDAQGRRVQ